MEAIAEVAIGGMDSQDAVAIAVAGVASEFDFFDEKVSYQNVVGCL